MAKFRLDSIGQLARQLAFAPVDIRAMQLARAEELLHAIDPGKAYPLDFVIYRITDYRPRGGGDEMLTGLALQHDLGLLIEQVSESLDVRAMSLDEPVLDIDDVCARFNVTSKTIQRWRRKGLPARRFVFRDGKRRIGFLLSSVEHFVAAHREQLAQSANISQVDPLERGAILRHARRLVARGCCVDELTRRIGHRMRRSALTILHTIRRHEQEDPDDAILAHAAPGLSESERAAVIKAWRRGAGIAELARRLNRPRSTIYRVVIDDRAGRLLRRKTRFFDDPLYHQPDAEAQIDAMVCADSLHDEPRREELRVPRDLPPYFQDLYRTPLLSKNKERALFLKLNFHKFQFVQARKKLDPELVRGRDLAVLERHLARIAETRNAIVRANLRLVVSVARKHLRGRFNLLDLISDGNLTLMRAVDGFDVNRGNRFSTYATLALMKGFARSVPAMLSHRDVPADDELLRQVPDGRQTVCADRVQQRDEVRQLLSRLDERERRVLCAHFGLDDGSGPTTFEQVGSRLGLSKERVRQIEQQAMAKLRAAFSSR